MSDKITKKMKKAYIKNSGQNESSISRENSV